MKMIMIMMRAISSIRLLSQHNKLNISINGVVLHSLMNRRQQKDGEELFNDYNSFRAVKE